MVNSKVDGGSLALIVQLVYKMKNFYQDANIGV